MRRYDDIPKEYWDDEPRRKQGGDNGNETGKTKIERSAPTQNPNGTQKRN